MNEQRSWSIPALPEQHLLPDVVVAFVDDELGSTAHDRAAAHFGRCPMCAAELAVQRQARSAVRAAETPSVPTGLLASLRSIPTDTDLPEPPGGGLVVGADGQLFAVQRPERTAFGSGAVLGTSAPLGHGSSVLRTGHGRRAVQGAGVVAAGLVLGALAVVGTSVLSVANGPAEPQHPDGSTVAGVGNAGDVVAANFSKAVGGSLGSVGPAPGALPVVPRAHPVRAR